MSVPAADLISAEIERKGAIPFERFMDLALYAPGAGYYVRGRRDPFGTQGDFYTAEQLQPVFGILISQLIRSGLTGIGADTVLEPGAGREEMAPAFAGLNYLPLQPGAPMPARFRGAVFANEFFDAHPVHLVRRGRSGWGEVYVTASDGRFKFAPRTRKVAREVAGYLARYHGSAPAASVVEVNARAAGWITALSDVVECGRIYIIDYGYTSAEYPRHSHGTLMSYHRHVASEDVLIDPGERDITAHVAWTPLQDLLRDHGWRVESFTTLARTLLDAGERDQFASVFEGCDAKEELRRRMQLKTLLFGMGETFRVLVASRGLTQ